MAQLGSSQRPLALGLDLAQHADPSICSNEPYQGHSTSLDRTLSLQPPTPISPISPMTPIQASSNASSGHTRDSSDQYETSHSSSPMAGPSNPHGSHAANLPIPPPPNPRRHRSGVLMSRVRANSSGTNFKSGHGVGSKSFGDLNLSFSMSSIDGEGSKSRSRSRERSGEVSVDGDVLGRSWDQREAMKRVVSEGFRRESVSEEDGMWDNSARFYHHLHSRPASRAPSRTTSPVHSPTPLSRADTPSTSTSASPIYVRRALTIPQGQNSPGHQHSEQPAVSSPSHHFLQAHLPPAFASSYDGSSFDHAHGHTHPSMVILTPTTQEWRELKEIRRQEGEDLESSEDTTSGSASQSDDSRRSSLQDDGSLHSSLLFGRDKKDLMMTASKPPLKTSLSADYLPQEVIHTPDPGSPNLQPAIHQSPERPVFKPVIIAPSPIAIESQTVPNVPQSPIQDQSESVSLTDNADTDQVGIDSSPEIDQDEPIMNTIHSRPARFNSIGRRESLRVVKPPTSRPGMPREKTKRELERERLFKELDEEIESEAQAPDRPRSASSVQEIGKGWGLASRPTSADRPSFEITNTSDTSGTSAEADLSEPKADIFEKTFEKKIVEDKPKAAPPIFRTNPSLSPTQPIKPSPLNASPVNAASGLPTPETPVDDTPILEIPPKAGIDTFIGAGQTANLDTIRDYARTLASPREAHTHIRERTGTTDSPPLSPGRKKTKGRRRDTNRVSLVAGRVVQPFTIPPSTALPPPERPPLKSTASKSSLQSFSPFRSPALGPTKSTGNIPPLFNRFDSSLSIAPSTGAPSECATPTSETAGGLGGRGIDDYVILKEAGKGAYGLVMRAKVKGPHGDPVGDEVIIKYIIKARILADCWKKHKQLGPIPVEIHVMDQLRHLLYNPPPRPHPWDPSRPRPDGTRIITKEALEATPNTPDSPRSDSSAGGSSSFNPTQKYIASEIRHSPERGHPNICKLLDFFEDREFYYLVMPRFGTGVDLFDRVESEPDGLEPYEIRSLLGQLSDAVRFLHSNGIVHRDIKDENVILDGNGRCQLIDFGSAAHWRPGKRWDTFSGTLHYASPEILRGVAYGGKEQDIWALGVVAYVLLVGETPFSELPDEVLDGLASDSGAEQALQERCAHGHEDEGGEPDEGGRLEDAADFVRRCLEKEPNERPNADVLCHHKYLRGEGGWTGKKGWIAKGFK